MAHRVSLLGVVAGLSVLLGCEGLGTLSLFRPPDAGTPVITEERIPQFQCDPAQAQGELALRRLSHIQVRNSVRAFVERVAPQSAASVLAATAGLVDVLPEDRRISSPGEVRGGFTRLDQAVQQEHVDALYRIGVALGTELTRTSALRTEVFGACATDADTANDPGCLEAFVREQGARLLRHPLAEEDVDFFVGLAGATPVAPEALADLIALMVNSPQFFYLVEHGQASTDPRAPLDPYELAARLSFHFWQSPPDDALWTAAASGALLTEEGYAAQVERLFQDPRTESAIDEFFLQWFRLYELPELDSLRGKPTFDAFLGADIPGPQLREAMVEDVLASARHQVRDGGTFSGLLFDRRSFAQDPLLARIVGAPVWDGGSAPPPATSAARVGLLTRPALLATGTANSRPIMKGVFIRTALMCEELPQPPGNANLVPPEPSANATTRETVEAITEAPGSVCAGCHKELLNPVGFATENFDALGRERAVEAIFDASGTRIAERAIRTDSIPHILPDDPRPSRGIEDVTRFIDASGKAHSCLARQYFRYTFSRREDPTRDGCALSQLESLAFQDASLASVLRAAALLPGFKSRSFQ